MPSSAVPWLEILAILLGPLVGIWVTRWIDKGKEKQDRRYRIFEDLVKTRGQDLSPQHVSALNMVPIVFEKAAHPAVNEAWERLMDSLNDAGWENEKQEVRDRVIANSLRLKATLVQTIATAVGQPLPVKEEHRPGYVPKAWVTEMQDNLEGRALLKAVLAGEQHLRMVTAVVDYTVAPDNAPRPIEEQLQPDKR